MTSVRAVERAIDILEAVAAVPDGIKIARLQAETGIARPTLYRIVGTLESRGLLRQCDDPTKYALDIGIVALAQPWMRSTDALSDVDAELEALAGAVEETVALCIFRGATRVYVREIPSPHALKYSIGIGVTESVLRGAGGHAILAFMEAETRTRLMSGIELPERKRLEGELERVRQAGYAVSEGQILDGATAIAAPVFDRAGRVMGSVGVYGPSVRLSGEMIAKTAAILLEHTTRINDRSS